MRKINFVLPTERIIPPPICDCGGEMESVMRINKFTEQPYTEWVCLCCGVTIVRHRDQGTY